MAAISQGIIVGASDRMITSGDVEFEPEQLRKVFQITPRIVAQWAGDAAYQREVLQAVTLRIRDVARQSPWTVQEVVELYTTEWLATKFKRAENAVLRPLGLTMDALIAGRHQLPERTVRALLGALGDWELSDERRGVTETIISGVDTAFPNGQPGVHLYKTWNGTYSCEDAIGFAAIGAGSWHANSQLMLARYSPQMLLPEALWLTYFAKRRAEVAPGVGSAGTDIFTLGSEQLVVVSPEWMTRLRDEYQKLEEAERGSRLVPIERIRKSLAEVAGTQAAAATTPLPAPPTAPQSPPESTHDQ